jgi:hypothetical protein
VTPAGEEAYALVEFARCNVSFSTSAPCLVVSTRPTFGR